MEKLPGTRRVARSHTKRCDALVISPLHLTLSHEVSASLASNPMFSTHVYISPSSSWAVCKACFRHGHGRAAPRQLLECLPRSFRPAIKAS